MCVCTPNVRTPWCGKPGCEEPAQWSPRPQPGSTFAQEFWKELCGWKGHVPIEELRDSILADAARLHEEDQKALREENAALTKERDEAAAGHILHLQQAASAEGVLRERAEKAEKALRNVLGKWDAAEVGPHEEHCEKVEKYKGTCSCGGDAFNAAIEGARAALSGDTPSPEADSGTASEGGRGQ
jgi:hypothetical protein